MFKANQPNAYDDIVAKTTDENLTSENWELILNLCDKVQDEGEQGARNVVAAVLKRLAHRNPNVQLYTLTLAEALTKNCGMEVHREIASRAFTQGLERLITDRTTHDKVRHRALALVAMWTSDFENDTTLGIMEECYENLKSKGYTFEGANEPPPPEVDDEVRRREEEELQRVLEMSMHDKGGRSQWESYSLAASSGTDASGSGSSSTHAPAPAPAQPAQNQPPRGDSYAQQSAYSGGYVPSASPATSAIDSSPSTVTSVTTSNISSTSSRAGYEGIPVVTRVRALHTFEPTEAGELAFEKGDIIKVVDRGYKDWWRGQLRGRTGIFPVNYVEPLPEPTAAEIAREAEQEAAVFSQAANVDRLLTLLRGMDPAKDNLADNEEIQELYKNCMSLRPKIVKLIDKYSQKRADLVSMNETFVKARTIFDRMMEESLARHTAMYDGRPPYQQAQSQSYINRPDSRARQGYNVPQGPQTYGWNGTSYEASGYAGYPGYTTSPQPQPQPYSEPTQQYVQRPPTVYAQGQSQVQPYGAPAGYTPQSHAPHQSETTSQPHQSQLPQVQPQQQPQAQPQAQVQIQQQSQAQSQAQVQIQQQSQAQGQPQQQQTAPRSGPPYVYDPKTTYADPNVQAWAQYYAQGGTDPTGAVYFFSVPGVKDGPVPVQVPVRAGSQDSAHTLQAGSEQVQLQAHAEPSQYTSQSAAPAQVANEASPYQHYTVGGAPQQSNPDLGNYPPAQTSTEALARPQYGVDPGAAHQSGPPISAGPNQLQQPAYGASPYGTTPASSVAEATPTPAVEQGVQPQQTEWQAQYQSLPNQFANMGVSSEGTQGVGAPA